MALLMEDDHATAGKHFNYDKIVEQQNLSKKKRKQLLKKGEEPLEDDDFQVRFKGTIPPFIFPLFLFPLAMCLLPILCFINNATVSLAPHSIQTGQFIIVVGSTLVRSFGTEWKFVT